MLTIHGVARSRASRILWLCEEMGIAYRHMPVIQAYRLADPDAADAPLNTRSPAFLAVNPNGRVPSIEDDGLVLCESYAINLYLARKHGGPLSPAGLREEGEMLMWTLWSVNEIEAHAIQILYHRVMKPEAERQPALADAAEEALRQPFAVLEKALAGSGHPVGGRFTVADINLAESVRYAMGAPALFEAAPNVKAWLSACHTRPAFKHMMAMREAEPA